MSRGTLFLLPVPLGPGDPGAVLPTPTLARVRSLDRFVAENAKTARAFLKAADHPLPLQQIAIAELNEHTPQSALPALLAPLLNGHDLGLVSEAGCPAVADPGSALVALAHRDGIRVVPMVGPSSLLLALMASGLNGQRFSFHGYLPAKEPARTTAIRTLEASSRKSGGVEILIETPYRNEAMFAALLAACQPTTRLCVAAGLTDANEWIATASVADWKRRGERPNLDKRPAVFLIQA